MKIDIQYIGCAEIYVHNNKLVTDSFEIASKQDSFETRSSANITSLRFYLDILKYILLANRFLNKKSSLYF